jgi:hypothetical protein
MSWSGLARAVGVLLYCIVTAVLINLARQLVDSTVGGTPALVVTVVGVLISAWGCALIMVSKRFRHRAIIYSVIVGGRMVHYGTDQAEAQQLAELAGGVIEPAPDSTWYPAEDLSYPPGAPHPADLDVALEYESWQLAIDHAEATGQPWPELALTGPPFFEGQLLTRDPASGEPGEQAST